MLNERQKKAEKGTRVRDREVSSQKLWRVSCQRHRGVNYANGMRSQMQAGERASIRQFEPFVNRVG